MRESQKSEARSQKLEDAGKGVLVSQSAGQPVTQNKGGNTMSQLKQVVAAVGLAAMMVVGVGVVGKVYAVNPDSIDIRVTVNIGLSVDIGTGAYSLGTLTSANAMKISTAPFPVTNDSAGLTEDYTISAANSANWTLSASTNGTNTAQLRMLVSTATNITPTNTDFQAITSTLTTTAANMTFGSYGFNGANGSGNDVAANGVRYMWFHFLAPSAITAGNNVEQTFTVTVTAADSSTF